MGNKTRKGSATRVLAEAKRQATLAAKSDKVKAKESAAKKATWAARTPEQRAASKAKLVATLAARTPEEKAAYSQRLKAARLARGEEANRKLAEQHSAALLARTVEEKAASQAKRRATLSKKSEKEKAARVEKLRETWATRTPEQAAASLAKRRATLSAKTQEEKEDSQSIRLLNLALNMDPAKLAALNAKQAKQAHWKSIPMEERILMTSTKRTATIAKKSAEERLITKKKQQQAAFKNRDAKSERQRAFYEAMSAERKIEINEKRKKTFASKTKKEKQAVSGKLRDAWARKSSEDIALREEKRSATMRERGTFSSSKPEDAAWELLCSYFGTENVQRHKRTPLYPFACDFVINLGGSPQGGRKNTLFIECNYHWTHGGGPYDPTVKEHRKIANKWKTGSKYYSIAHRVWTKADVKKREHAQASKLLWFEFWDSAELETWLARAFSRLSLSYFEDSLHAAWRRISRGKPRWENAFTYAYFPHFYHNEQSAWLDKSKKFSLILNRQHYLGKSLTDMRSEDLLTGFKKAGLIHNTYSHFKVSLVKRFISEVSPSSVYDPTAGWGTRLLTFHAAGVHYVGNDAWRKTAQGLVKIVKWLKANTSNSASLAVRNHDAAKLDLRSGNHDSVFTCPPYPEKAEIYANGAESLPLDLYWRWWSKVIHMSVGKKVKSIGLVIPSKFLDSYEAPILKKGFKRIFVEDIGNNDTHLVRRKNTEVLCVWERGIAQNVRPR